jgi:hypothetical protein
VHLSNSLSIQKCITTTHHLKRTAQNTAQDVAKPQPAFERVFWEFHKLGQGILV